MKEIKFGTPEWDRLNDEEQRRLKRLGKQKDDEDYSFDEDGKPEKCRCGSKINSHGHCPRCDY